MAPPPTLPGAVAIIDWANFVRFNGVIYLGNYDTDTGRSLKEEDLGPVYATVQFRLDGNVSDPSYHAKDGDAAFLEPGTPVCVMKGYRLEFRLAARLGDRLVLYEADTNPAAQSGADLLDLAGKVEYIGVNSPQDGVSELGAIKDPQQVAALVAMVLAAPVDQNRRDHAATMHFIAFHFEDGTTATRAYWPESGELSRGIILPKEFRTAVEQALKK
jgi:hypothetical protein